MPKAASCKKNQAGMHHRQAVLCCTGYGKPRDLADAATEALLTMTSQPGVLHRNVVLAGIAAVRQVHSKQVSTACHVVTRTPTCLKDSMHQISGSLFEPYNCPRRASHDSRRLTLLFTRRSSIKQNNSSCGQSVSHSMSLLFNRSRSCLFRPFFFHPSVMCQEAECFELDTAS